MSLCNYFPGQLLELIPTAVDAVCGESVVDGVPQLIEFEDGAFKLVYLGSAA